MSNNQRRIYPAPAIGQVVTSRGAYDLASGGANEKQMNTPTNIQVGIKVSAGKAVG